MSLSRFRPKCGGFAQGPRREAGRGTSAKKRGRAGPVKRAPADCSTGAAFGVRCGLLAGWRDTYNAAVDFGQVGRHRSHLKCTVRGGSLGLNGPVQRGFLLRENGAVGSELDTLEGRRLDNDIGVICPSRLGYLDNSVHAVPSAAEHLHPDQRRIVSRLPRIPRLLLRIHTGLARNSGLARSLLLALNWLLALTGLLTRDLLLARHLLLALNRLLFRWRGIVLAYVVEPTTTTTTTTSQIHPRLGCAAGGMPMTIGICP